MTNKNLISWSSLIVLAVLFLALIMLTNAVFRGARVDLTQNQLYTLSEGTVEVIQSVEEPISLRLFFSEETSREFPLMRAYYQRVREILEEFEERSNGKLQVSFIDPKPFSEEEDQASLYGIQGVPVGNLGDSFYFGLAGTNSVDDVQVVPFMDPRRERFFEYELAKLIYSLDHPDRPRIGMISSLSIGGSFDPHSQQQIPAYTIYEQLQQFYEVVDIAETESVLPENLDAVIIVHPKEVSQALLYDVDQYALNGGGVLIFVDPHAQNDKEGIDASGLTELSGSSDLPLLFETWGVKYRDNFWAGDLRYALEVTTNQGQQRHVGILGLDKEVMSSDSVITATISSLNISTSGFFEPLEGATTTIEPLVTSSGNSQAISSLLLDNTKDISKLLKDFEVTDTIFNLAVRLSGPVKTAFPDGAPAGVDGDDQLKEGDINVLLVGDTEMLSDIFWAQRQSFFGQPVVTPFAGNGDFVLNMVENISGSNSLAAVRPRDVANRPFTLVEELRVQAEEQYRATEKDLETELHETEAKLNEMQLARGDSDLTVLSDEQQAELQKFLDHKVEIRKELRQVRRNLDRDIENLGAWLKVINILLIPVLVAVAALLFFLRRRRLHAGAKA
ncbi:MAG: GldG family protein [Xanthomonadales bacterium]|nr:GldG family protein [Xanthomonadales bacterium]